jgi:hypothetical protein
MNKKVLLLLTLAALLHCTTPVQREICTACLSPALVLSFFNASTNQKILLSELKIIFSNSDTITVASDSLPGSGWCFCNSADSTCSVYHGPGMYTLLMNDPLYQPDSLDSIRVTDDGSPCKRIYTRYLEIGVAPESLAKAVRKQSVIIRQHTKLGC